MMLSLCRQAKRARLLVVECQGVASQADARRRQRQPVFIRQRHLRRDPQRRVRAQLQVILAVRADRVGYHLLGKDISLSPVFSSVWQSAVACRPMGQVVLAVRANQEGSTRVSTDLCACQVPVALNCRGLNALLPAFLPVVYAVTNDFKHKNMVCTTFF